MVRCKLLPAWVPCGALCLLLCGACSGTAPTSEPAAAPPTAALPTAAPAGHETHPGTSEGMASAPMGTIRIVEPAEGTELAAGNVVVRVEVAGVPADEVHWHLTVNGQESGMINGLETELELAPGKHELMASLSSGETHEVSPDAPQSTVRVTVGP
jgi:hypothetical protein